MLGLIKTSKVAAVVLLVAIFFILLPADVLAAERKFPGDQWPAENYQVGKKADIFTEKKIEAVTYPLNLMLLGLAGATFWAGGGVSVIAQRVFTEMLAGYAINVSVQNQPATSATALVWLNYPPSAYSFQSATKHEVNFVKGAVTNISTTVFDWIANQLFFVSKVLVMIANNIVVLCFDSQWVRSAADWISDGVKTVSSSFSSGGGGWLFVFFVLALCALAANVAIHLLRARVVNALTAVLVAGACVAGLYFYTANANYVVAAVSEFTDNMAGLAMSAASVLSPQTTSGAGSLSPLRQGIAEVTNMAWFSNVACPWSAGQFGTANPKNLKITQSEWDGSGLVHSPYLGGSPGIKDCVPPDYTDVPPPAAGQRLTRSELEQMVKNGTLYADTLYLGADDEVREGLLQALSSEVLDHGQHRETVFTCGPEVSTAWRHVLAAFVSFFPALAYLLLVVFVGVPVIFAQLILMVLLIFLPVALVIGVSGDNGRRAMLGYIKYIIGCFAAKIVNGFFLGTVLFFAAVFSQALLG